MIKLVKTEDLKCNAIAWCCGGLLQSNNMQFAVSR